ncbi:hypothetical protein SDJN03_07351, partial [Cucurbita argyrosperma subsp. sororia]
MRRPSMTQPFPSGFGWPCVSFRADQFNADRSDELELVPHTRGLRRGNFRSRLNSLLYNVFSEKVKSADSYGLVHPVFENSSQFAIYYFNFNRLQKGPTQREQNPKDTYRWRYQIRL